MNTTTAAPKSRLYSIVSIIVNAFMLMAATISFSHIITTASRLGVTSWQTYTVPAFIDGLAILGMIGRSEAMARELRRRNRTEAEIAAVRQFAFWLQLTAGLLSLAANFYAGVTLGDRLFGLLVVAGFIVSEKFSEKLRAVGTAVEAAPQITAADVAATVRAAVADALAQAAVAHAADTAAAVLAAEDRMRAEAAKDAKRAADRQRRQQRAAERAAVVAEAEALTEAYAPRYH